MAWWWSNDQNLLPIIWIIKYHCAWLKTYVFMIVFQIILCLLLDSAHLLLACFSHTHNFFLQVVSCPVKYWRDSRFEPQPGDQLSCWGLSWFSIVVAGKCQDSAWNWTMTTSFHIHSNLFLLFHYTLCKLIHWLFVEWTINKWNHHKCSW